MAVEKRRGCGYRKVGGLYLCGEGGGESCCKMPIPLDICPTCNHGIKQSRGWQWIDPRPWLAGECTHIRPMCPLISPWILGDRVGLIWVGTQFYPTPEDFEREARESGISRRIKAVPRGIEIGKTWVFLAHPRAVFREDGSTPDGVKVFKPGVIKVFKPTRIEKIVTQTQSEDEDEMAELEKRGITPFVVPDNDRDHQGSVYDKEEPQLELPV